MTPQEKRKELLSATLLKKLERSSVQLLQAKQNP